MVSQVAACLAGYMLQSLEIQEAFQGGFFAFIFFCSFLAAFALNCSGAADTEPGCERFCPRGATAARRNKLDSALWFSLFQQLLLSFLPSHSRVLDEVGS